MVGMSNSLRHYNRTRDIDVSSDQLFFYLALSYSKFNNLFFFKKNEKQQNLLIINFILFQFKILVYFKISFEH